MARNWILNISRLSLCLILASCKAPVSFESLSSATSTESSESSSSAGSETADSATSEEDQEVVDSVCSRADADSRNAFEGDIAEKPFLSLSFAAPKALHVPQQKCVKVEVLEDSDVKRDVLYTYDCKTVAGTVELSTEQRDSSMFSQSAQNIVVLQGKEAHTIKSVESKEKFKAGSLIIDQDFEESFQRGEVAHLISGVNSYDFSADENEDEEGYVSLEPLSGFVQLEGNFIYTKNGVTDSVRTVTSSGLHRSACGFDDGSIAIKSADKTVTVTYTACGKKSVKTE